MYKIFLNYIFPKISFFEMTLLLQMCNVIELYMQLNQSKSSLIGFTDGNMINFYTTRSHFTQNTSTEPQYIKLYLF